MPDVGLMCDLLWSDPDPNISVSVFLLGKNGEFLKTIIVVYVLSLVVVVCFIILDSCIGLG